MKIISSAPCRISLAGGGTDVGEYAQKYGGLCINMAINIRHHIEISTEDRLLIDDNGKFFDKFAEILKLPNITHTKDGEIGAGLGSSAAVGVAMVAAASKFWGSNFTKEKMAELAWEIEVNKVGFFGGRQDHYCSAFGGVNAMYFTKERVEVIQLNFSFLNKLFPYLLLIDTGIKRQATTTQDGFKKIDKTQKESLDKIKGFAMDFIDLVRSENIRGIGELIDESWKYKKLSNKVSTPEIDEIYESAKSLGVWGGKLLGAGGAGCLLFVVEPDKHGLISDQLKNKFNTKRIDFAIDWNGAESRRVEE